VVIGRKNGVVIGRKNAMVVDCLQVIERGAALGARKEVTHESDHVRGKMKKRCGVVSVHLPRDLLWSRRDRPLGDGAAQRDGAMARWRDGAPPRYAVITSIAFRERKACSLFIAFPLGLVLQQPKEEVKKSL